MALYSQTIKNIVAGISQQPAPLRAPEQLDAQENGFSTEAAGLQKRPPTVLVKALYETGDDTVGNSLLHWVDRDEKEKYVMIVNNKTINAVKVYDLQGNEKNVTMNGTALDYISYGADEGNPQQDFVLLTVADHTFILNKRVQTALTDAVEAKPISRAVLYVKSGQYGRNLTFTLKDGTATTDVTVTQPNGGSTGDVTSLDSVNIAKRIYDALKAKTEITSKFDLEQNHDSIILTEKVAGSLDKISFTDGFADTSAYLIKGSVNRFNLLPPTCVDGFTVKVLGDPSGGSVGGYWVKYDAAKSIWKEVAAPGVKTTIDPSKMPHEVIRNADGTFTVQPIEWDKRIVGDEDSNPPPSFIGNKLNDMFFYRNRLGFLSGENVILSENDNFFNFWMTTSNDVLDTDTIDLPTTTSRINILHYAVAWDESLYLFSDSTQFILNATGTLTPKTAELLEVTGFNSSPSCRPIVSGKNVYFSAERAEYATIKEYYTVQNVTDVKNAQDITAHIPSYIPNGVVEITPNTSENIMLVRTEGQSNALFVYKYLFINENRVQSAWSRWTFHGKLLGSGFYGSTLYFLIETAGMITMEKMDLTYNTKDFSDEPFRLFMDSKRKVSNVVYEDIYENSAIDLYHEFGVNGEFDAGMVFQMVTDDGQVYSIPSEKVNAANGVWQLPGDFRPGIKYIGIQYEFLARLSTLYIKQQRGDGSWVAKMNGRLQIRTVKIAYNDTGNFSVIISTNAGHTREYVCSTRILGTPSALLGLEPSGSGQFRAPVQSLNLNCSISIVGKEPLPISIVGVVWESNFVTRTKEV